MKKILVSGGTGFIGRHVVRALAARGDSVTVLSRSRRSAGDLGPNVASAEWTPDQKGDWYAAVDGQDVVLSLAGEPAVGVRWTDSAKRRIVSSRVESNRQLSAAIGAASKKPELLLGVSGVGYYGYHAGHVTLDESAPAGDDFLARVCVEWEAAENEARAHGVRVVNARLGIVLARDGGALVEMARPFRLFAGGPIGSGEQVVSWIHIEDLVSIFFHIIDDAAFSGPVNVVSPNAVTNAELSRQIGEVLGRPSWLRVPGAALRARFGEGAEPLLGGQRVKPSVLAEHGYVFRMPSLAAALEEALG